MPPHFTHPSSTARPASSLRNSTSNASSATTRYSQVQTPTPTPTRPHRLAHQSSTPSLYGSSSVSRQNDHIVSTPKKENAGFRIPVSTTRASSSLMNRPASSLSAFNNKSTPRASSSLRPASTLRSRSSMSNINDRDRSAGGSATLSRPSSSLGSGPSSAIPYSGTIKVSVRPRPLDDSTSSSSNIWTINHLSSTIYNSESGEFQYDHVYQPFVNNQQVYVNSVEPVVSQCLAGYNGTIFAYGMTGSGKTYSMQGTPEETGIIDLCVGQIFSKVESDQLNGIDYSIQVSYLEIYNERLFDLLDPDSANSLKSFNSSVNNNGPSSTPSKGGSGMMNNDELRIRDDPVFGVKVVGLREYEVKNADQLMDAIYKGDRIRRTGGTDFNSRSSRSHAVLLIRIKSKQLSTNTEKFSTLCLCDLAGSEKATTQIERRKEGSFINKSLLALGTVIGKLSQQSLQLNSMSSGAAHIPYRDSKLTRLLQPSLSGNSVVSILCTIHLSINTQSETLNTLRFASRAKNITLNAKKNEVVGGGSVSSYEKDKLIEELFRENERYKIEIQALKSGQSLSSSSSSLTTATSYSPPSDTVTMTNSEVEESKEKLAQLSAENKILNEQLEHLKRIQDNGNINSIMVKNEDIQTLLQLDLDNSVFYDTVDSLNKYFDRQMLQIDELKSYVSHLENQLGTTHYNKMMKLDKSSNSKELGSPVSKRSATNPSDTHSYSADQDLLALLKDQEEEIQDLKRALTHKDSIIKALKTSSKVREMVTNPLTSSTNSPVKYNDENVNIGAEGMESKKDKMCLRVVTNKLNV